MGLAAPERPEEPVDDGKTLFEVSLFPPDRGVRIARNAQG